MVSLEGLDMEVSLHAQMNLFASPARRPELTGLERQKAVALLQALLLEAVKNPALLPENQRKAGNE
jgi:hypothetical protein